MKRVFGDKAVKANGYSLLEIISILLTVQIVYGFPQIFCKKMVE